MKKWQKIEQRSDTHGDLKEQRMKYGDLNCRELGFDKA